MLDHARLRELFLSACDLPGPEQTNFVEEHCLDDPDLRHELELLLRTDAREKGIFADDKTTAGIKFQFDTVVEQQIPKRIGQYRVKKVLGEGGMGVVYLAEQQNPRRDVAVKVIRSGLMSTDLLKRFEFEATVLGRLTHPGIARIYEAGTFVDGEIETERPFLAMDYIDGQPLLQFAGQAKLGIRERLQLMVQICEAVHHAHQRGVIHRDLKPGNVLVKNDRQPCVLDFGVARATGIDREMSTLQTRAGQVIGTLPYMSPEQVVGNSLEADTRSDVYSLGVIAYELLTGKLPYDIDEAEYLQAAKAISENQPVSMSSIDAEFRGDLNTIVLKALEKEPDRRYQSAKDFGDDVQRYLDHQPVLARPASTFYQLKQFSKRNKGLVVGVLASIALLVAGVIGTTIGMVNARNESARNDAVNEFMKDILIVEDETSGDPNIKMVEVLRAAASSAPEQFRDYPELEAEVNHLLGNAFIKLTMFADAIPLHQRAYDIRRSQFGLADPLTREAGIELSSIMVSKDAAKAIEIAQGLLDNVPPSESKSQDAFRLQNSVSRAQFRLGEMDAAELGFRDVLLKAHQAKNFDGKIVHNTKRHLTDALRRKVNLGLSDDREQDIREAIELLRDVFEESNRDSGEFHVNSLRTGLKLGTALKEIGEYQEAEQLSRRVIEVASDTLDADHDLIFQAKKELARNLYWQTEYVEAAENSIEAVELLRNRNGSSIGVLVAMQDCIEIAEAGGRFVEGEEYSRLLLEKLSGHYDKWTNVNRLHLARFLSGLGKNEEAEIEFEKVIQSGELETNSYLEAAFALYQGEHYLTNGDPVKASELFDEALRLRKQLKNTIKPSMGRFEDSITRMNSVAKPDD